MKITRRSTLTGTVHTRDIPVKPEDYTKWFAGDRNIQEVMPYLSADDREFIVSGITPEEWDDEFGTDDGAVPAAFEREENIQ